MRSLLITFGIILTIQSYGQDYNHVFVFLNSKPDKEEINTEAEEALQKAHRENIGKLVAEGKMIVAGPFDGGGGIFILTTGQASVAQDWLESDPAIKANRWDIELYPIKYLHGGACLAKEPYEMVSYNFARVNYVNDISSYKTNQGGNIIWESFVDEVDILMVGVFPNNNGGIIVYTGREKPLWFGNKQDEQVSLEQMKLWVAKGSFCE